ncbi:MAG: UDP-3-O-(3-hydroxymyristoyl)glucosamine N-acyltransferase [Simkaniaceae bacterium]|nr:UDP-3-O-(3-hydroxymyristoyl)glucosamine N-acyltransferase [Candidatus Sacchlamyda saccharinae]
MNHTLASLASLTGARLQGDPEKTIENVADLASATPTDASFLANTKYTPLLTQTQAGVICVSEEEELPSNQNFLISSDPSRTFQQIAEALQKNRKPSGFTGIHPTAIVHPSAQIAENVTIGPYAVIDQDTSIGPNTTIDPHVTLYPGVQIGSNCHLHAHVTVREYCSLADRVILQPGAVIGSCGFGYTTNETGEHTKLEQLGNVILEDNVEIGANTTVDRARFKTTRIGKGTKIDNLVQIAHNVEIGQHNIIAAQTGIAGTTKTGRNVMMGGQVGIVGHLEITDFVMIATRGGVSKSITKSGRYAGGPVMTLAQHNKTQVHTRKIDTYARRIDELEKKLAALQ